VLDWRPRAIHSATSILCLSRASWPPIAHDKWALSRGSGRRPGQSVCGETGRVLRKAGGHGATPAKGYCESQAITSRVRCTALGGRVGRSLDSDVTSVQSG
jgi:hypothetical protein